MMEKMYSEVDDCPCACGKLLSTHEVSEECMEIFEQAIIQSLQITNEVKITGKQSSGRINIGG